jgi:predicted amidohydrolase YtcJ
VIDRDYFTCPEDDIRKIRPEMTVLDGKVVYRRP